MTMLPSLALAFSVLVFIATCAAAAVLVAGGRRLRALRDVPPIDDLRAPSMSVIVAALNEAGTIEPALRSLLALDYPDLEIVAVDDRSTDATPAILDRLAADYPRLRVLHVEHLPAGWLGKNHALWQAAQSARGEYLLFTDADVHFEASALRRAARHCRAHALDHLSVFPSMPSGTLLLDMLMLQFGVGFLLRYRPWKVQSSGRHYLGQGAFNMVRHDAYRAAGGHAAIPMAVIDDMMLGQLMKRHGCRQDVLIGQDMLSVRWYPNVRAMFAGLRKNIFAAFDYRLPPLIAASAGLAAIGIWPWLGLAAGGATRAVNLATIAVNLLLYGGMARTAGWSLACLLWLPLATPLTLAMWWQACLLTLARGGIVWRGTRYPLAELRRHDRAQ
ncbi:MAG: glycosyltransferase [Burkholderiaceae bacterium]